MALQQVNFGSASDGSQGDTARAAFGKLNQNFSDTTNAASRLVGTAAGQVMEVGAFGLGAASLSQITNIDNMTVQPGWYLVTSSTTGSVPTGFGVLRVDSHALGTSSSNWANQTLYGTNGKVYYRSSINLAAWSAWREQPFSGDSPSFASVNLSAGLNLAPTTGDAALSVSGKAGQFRYMRMSTLGSLRWDIGTNSDAESGSNAGSNFYIHRFSDASAFLDRPFAIDRATGETRLTRATVSGPLRPGQYTLASLPSASAFTGYEIDVTDASGGAKRCRSDGTNWKILNTTTTVS